MCFAPLGFNWQISIALVPGMAAREVVVGALGTVYALSATGDDGGPVGSLIAQQWSLITTALSLLVWFVFAHNASRPWRPYGVKPIHGAWRC